MPSVPGMRTSEMSTSGCSARSASKRLSADSKVRVFMPSLFERAVQHPADGGVVIHDPDGKLAAVHGALRLPAGAQRAAAP